jgi:hypothetical protein
MGRKREFRNSGFPEPDLTQDGVAFRKFMKERSITAKQIALAYGFKPQMISVWSQPPGPQNHKAMGPRAWHRFHDDRRRDPDSTAQWIKERTRYLEPQQPYQSDPERDMQTALCLSETDHVAGAVPLAIHAVQSARAQGPDVAARYLSTLLYLAHRHSPPPVLLDIVQNVVGPIVESLIDCRSPQITRSLEACLGQLGAILNEGGAYDRAAGIFSIKFAERFSKRADRYTWCGPYIMNNVAEHCNWSGGGLGRALDITDRAKGLAGAATEAASCSVQNWRNRCG